MEASAAERKRDRDGRRLVWRNADKHSNILSASFFVPHTHTETKTSVPKIGSWLLKHNLNETVRLKGVLHQKCILLNFVQRIVGLFFSVPCSFKLWWLIRQLTMVWIITFSLVALVGDGFQRIQFMLRVCSCVTVVSLSRHLCAYSNTQTSRSREQGPNGEPGSLSKKTYDQISQNEPTRNLSCFGTAP